MLPYFSIAIPAFNMAGKMDKCMKSLKEQTFSDFEVILIDDGSTDLTLRELEQIQKEDNRFQVISHGRNQSLLATRYTGMKHAKGKYMLFLDSDDYLEQDTLLELYEYLEKSPVDIVMFGLRYEPSGVDLFPQEGEDPLQMIFEEKMPPGITKNCYSAAVIRKVLKRSESFYCNMGEDVCLSGILFSCAESFGRIQKSYYHYILGNGMSNSRKSASMEKVMKDMRSTIGSGEHLLEFIEKYNPEYLEAARKKVQVMYRFNLAQVTLFEKDFCRVVEILNMFHIEGMEQVYDWGANTLLPYLMDKVNGTGEISEESRQRFIRVLMKNL